MNRLPLSAVKSLPNVSAVYFIIDEANTILYIGASKVLRSRLLGDHHRKSALREHGASATEWREVPRDNLAREEAEEIAKCQPVLNKGKSRYVLRPDSTVDTLDTHIYFPKKVLNELRKYAKINRRSVTAETIIAVERYIREMRAANDKAGK